MADLGEEAYSSQMKVIATFLRLLEELMRNKQQDLRYGTKTQRRGIFRRMKDFVGGVFKKVYDGTFGRLSRNGKDWHCRPNLSRHLVGKRWKAPA